MKAGYNMNERAEKAKQFIKQNIWYIVIFVASIVYISRGIITISDTGKTISEIIVDGSIAFLYGLFINRIFDIQGMMQGDRNERVQKTYTLHSDIVTKISPYIDKLDYWCEKKNKEALKTARIRVLGRVGLKYEDCFSDDGVAKEYKIDESKFYSNNKIIKKNEKLKYKTFLSACNLRLTLLTTSALTSEGVKENDPFNFGPTKRQYETRKSFQDVIFKVGIAVITGLYGVKLIENFSWAFLIWTGLQVVLFLLIGAFQMYRTYLFVVDDFRNRIIKKIDRLEQFECDIIKNLPKQEISVATSENDVKPNQYDTFGVLLKTNNITEGEKFYDQ